MSLKCGILGLPNVGKSTLFNSVSSGKAEAANFPFCTIEPNLGVVTVPDERLDELSKLVNPTKTTPTTVNCNIESLTTDRPLKNGSSQQMQNKLSKSAKPK